jgi:hypothetical protein
MRRDLVNFKKICLHIQEGGTHTCKDLRQLCAFFRTDTQNHDSFFTPVDRYGSISDTMQECAGALDAVADGRRLSKAMCCIPRMPDKPLSEYLLNCPHQLQSSKNLSDAEEFLSTAHVLQKLVCDVDVEIPLPPEHRSLSVDHASIDYDPLPAISKMISQSWALPSSVDAPCLDYPVSPSPPTGSSALSPAYVISTSMTARGGWKALRMRGVLQHVTACLQLLLQRIRHALHRLSAMPSLDQVRAILLEQRRVAAATSAVLDSPVAAAAVDDTSRHRAIVGCAIKRRRYLSLLTGVMNLAVYRAVCLRVA